MITFEEFRKLDLRIATITSAERVEGSEKLLILKISLGESERQILAGIGKEYDSTDLPGKQIVIVANLEPKTLMGHESNGMLLAADNEGRPILLIPEKEVPNGSPIH